MARTIQISKTVSASRLSGKQELDVLSKSIQKILRGEVKGVDYSKIDKEFLESLLKGVEDIKHGRVHRVA